MYPYLKNRNIEENSVDYSDTSKHRRLPTLELKLSIIRRCFEDWKDIKSVSEETGYLRTSWVTIVLKIIKWISHC